MNLSLRSPLALRCTKILRSVLVLIFVFAFESVHSQTVSRFNFTNVPQNIPGWIDLAGQPHEEVISNTDPATGITVSSIATNQWNPVVYGSPTSAYNGGVTNGTVQPSAVVQTNWFNYNAPYGTVVNGTQQEYNIRVSGLSRSHFYRFFIGASRANGGGTPDQYGIFEYRLNYHPRQTLLVTDNTTQQVVFENVVSSEDGIVLLSARKIRGSDMNFGYLGWLVIEDIGTINSPPTANAGPDVVITLPQTSVTLSGSGIDTDGVIASYAWTQSLGWEAILSGANTSTLTVSGLSAGTYEFKLRVTDDDGAFAIDAVQIIVNPQPTISRFNFTNAPQNIPGWIDLAGHPHQSVISNTDPATGVTVSSIATNQWNPAIYGTPTTAYNGGVTYGEVQDAAVVQTNWFNYNAPFGSVVNGVVQGDNIGISGLDATHTYKISIGASRGAGGTADQYGTFEYRLNGSQVQTLLVTNNATQEVIYDEIFPDVNGYIGLSARKISGSDMNFGYAGWLVVEDLGVDSQGTNLPPIADAGPDFVLNFPSTIASLPASGSDDPDGSIVSYAWRKISGEMVAFNGADSEYLTVYIISFNIGPVLFELTVTDDDGATDTDTVMVILNYPPTVDAGPTRTVTRPASSIVITANATDSDGTIQDVHWSKLSGGPATLSDTSSLSLTASNLEVGEYIFHLTVTDNLGATAEDYVTVNVVYTDYAKFNFSNTMQSITGWNTLGGSPHAQVLEARDANSNILVNSVATNQWNPVNYGSGPLSSYNGGVTNGSVQPAAVVQTNWFNYVSPYAATVNGAVQGDNLQIMGLVPNQAYDISIGASRASGAVPEQYGLMEYRFNAANPQNLLVTNNVSNQVVVTAMADASGRIGISARKISGSNMNFGYIGWLVVAKSDGSGGARLSLSQPGPVEETTGGEEPWVSVFPNPAIDELNLQVRQGEPDAVTVMVNDITGKTMLVHRAQMPEGTSNIVFSELKSKGFTPGMYVIKVRNSRQSSYLKVLVR